MSPILDRAINKLARWRSVFAGWQLGTRSDTDAECRAVRDHRETTMVLRAEVNALVQLHVKAGHFTVDQWEAQLATECMLLDKSYEEKFPGFRTSDAGVVIDPKVAAVTMKSWRP